MKRIFSILFALVLVVSFSLIPSALVGASPGPGLAGLWHLDEGSGTTAYDSSSNGNDGTLEGGFGNALSFDGVDDYVEVAHDASLEPSEITIEAWIYPLSWDHTPTAVALATKRTAYGNGYFLFWYASTSTINFDWGGSTGANRWNTGYNPPLNTWTHLAVTRSSAGRALYVNGALYSSTTHVGAPANVPTTSALRVGYDSFEARYPFKGSIDEVRLSNVVRTSFNLGSPYTVDANTVALWHFDKGTGQVAADSAGSNDGQLGLTNGVDTNDPAWVVSEIPAAGPTWTSGMFDGALSFDGSDDYVDCGDISTQNWSGLTTEAWIYWDGVTSHGYAGVYHKRYHNDIGRLLINSGGKVLVQNGNGNFFSDNNGDVPTNQWSHIAYVYDQIAGKEYIYVNGAKKGDQPRSGDIIQNSADFWIGYGWHGSTYYVFSGLIDEVRVWDVALSSQEILESASLGEAGNNANYDTIVSHEAGSSVFIFTSAFHDVDGDDNIRFRLMRVGSTATINGTAGTNGISIRRVTPKGSTWTLDGVADGDPSATERNIDPGEPDGPRPHQTLHLYANLTGGLEPLGFNLHTKGL